MSRAMKVVTYNALANRLSEDTLPSMDEGIAFHNGVLRGLALAGWRVISVVQDEGVRLEGPDGSTILLEDYDYETD